MPGMLIEEPPLVISPSLAAQVGLNEAIVLQQIHYWSARSRHEHEGRRWVHNTYEEWREQFPFWSCATIRRTVASLREKGLVVVAKSPAPGSDRTNWYAVDYAALEGLNPDKQSCAQSEQMPPGHVLNVSASSAQNERFHARASLMQSETTQRLTEEEARGRAGTEAEPEQSAMPVAEDPAAAEVVAILGGVAEGRRIRRPTLAAVGRVIADLPGRDYAALARDCAFWLEEGKGRARQRVDVVATYRTFVKTTDPEKRGRRERARADVAAMMSLMGGQRA